MINRALRGSATTARTHTSEYARPGSGRRRKASRCIRGISERVTRIGHGSRPPVRFPQHQHRASNNHLREHALTDRAIFHRIVYIQPRPIRRIVWIGSYPTRIQSRGFDARSTYGSEAARLGNLSLTLCVRNTSKLSDR